MSSAECQEKNGGSSFRRVKVICNSHSELENELTSEPSKIFEKSRDPAEVGDCSVAIQFSLVIFFVYGLCGDTKKAGS